MVITFEEYLLSRRFTDELTEEEKKTAIEQRISLSHHNYIECAIEYGKLCAIDAYKKGYEQRVIDQLKGALDGSPIGSHYKEEKLNELANVYASKHCA